MGHPGRQRQGPGFFDEGGNDTASIVGHERVLMAKKYPAKKRRARQPSNILDHVRKRNGPETEL